ncbi:MAG: threonylcarbamoyl-AMP synthase [Actinobacteria bacterium]|nr:threonylcarbamoyl-AMP synthase [Actinomycetota bacterium]
MAAAVALRDGRLAVLPTETVYGLGARADMPRAVARIYAAKGRPADHPLIVHVAHASYLPEWGHPVPSYATALARAFWPGPLTLVVPRTARAGDFITGGQDTIAVRVSSHPGLQGVLRHLAAMIGDPAVGIAAPSANRFGQVSPTTAGHALDELADVLDPDDVLLDGGPCEVGVESTIVDCTGTAPVVLRPGQVTAGAIERAANVRMGHSSPVRTPGTLPSHYAPSARVIITSPQELADRATLRTDASVGVIALADIATPPGLVRLSEPVTSDDYARVLYAALREADALRLTEVLAVPPPRDGVGAAVLDRLTRAAT